MAKPSKPVSEIDRLIELASEVRPRAAASGDASKPALSLSLEDQKDPQPSMWRVLLQLRVLLPYLAKVLPLVERGLLGTNLTGHAAPSIDTSHLDRGIAGLGEAQRDLNTAVQAQTAEIKFLQEQVTWLGESLEKNMLRQAETAEEIESLKKLAKTWVIVLAVLLGIVIALAVVLLARSL